ncbi:PAS domain-containing protein [Tepidicaulis sp.]|uniref:PAS domain-containing protein n=1 Tax=Tepidicaulis sp. TaxID=1920809 RepID=UPI003B5C8E37
MVLNPIQLADLDPRHPVAVYAAYHQKKMGADNLLLKDNFDPIDLPKVLPWMMILDKTGDPADPQFLYRLAGTGCREIFGIDYTGKLLGDNLPADAAEQRREEILDVMERRTPSITRTAIPLAGREFMTIIRGVFAVSSDGETIDRIHIIIAPESQHLRNT